MWGFKQSVGVDQPLRKFLDASRDSLKRLRSFKQVLERLSQPEKKPFFEKHHEIIFFTIYSSFTTIEACLQSKASKKSQDSHFSELMKTVLPSLETVIILLPEKLFDKWQSNSICSVIHKVLHPENDLTLRCYGIKLLVLYMLAAQDNVNESCLELFSTAVPGFPPPFVPAVGESVDATTSDHSSSVFNRYGSYSPSENTTWWDATPGIGDAVGIAKVKPLFLETKPANLKVPRTRYIMDCLMHVMTSQVGRIQWADPNHHFRGFAFLYHQFKLRYLAPLYKDFRFARQIYLPGTSGSTSMEPISVASPSNPASLPGKGDRISSLIRLAYDTSDPIYSQTKQLVLQKILNWLLYRSSERLLVNIPDDLTQEMLHSGSYPSQLNGVDLLNKMHFSTCDNITLLLEMLRQGFSLPVIYKVPHQIVELYHKWMEDRPVFMLDPTSPSEELQDNERLSWETLGGRETTRNEELRAGLQASLRMFIEHTRGVFSIKQDGKVDRSHLGAHVDLCKQVIELYRLMVKKWLLDQESWLYLLQTLLDITESVMEENPPVGGVSTLSTQLAEPLLKTLLVSYVRASIAVPLPSALWDALQKVMEERKEWKIVVISWQEIVDLITHVLGQVLYGLDVTCLPLDQLEQRKQVRQRTGISSRGEHSLQNSHTSEGRKHEFAPIEEEKHEVTIFDKRKNLATLLSATTSNNAPPTSPSFGTGGRRLSFRRVQKLSQPESVEYSHRYWDRPPERSPAPIGKNVSNSENVLDRSFDIPSPSSCIPPDSASVSSVRAKSVAALPHQLLHTPGGSPQLKRFVSAQKSEVEQPREGDQECNKLRKATSEHILSKSQWDCPDSTSTPSKPAIPSSSTSPSIADKQSGIHGNMSIFEPAEILVDDDSEGDGDGEGEGEEDNEDCDGHQDFTAGEEENETQRVATGWTPEVATVVWLRMIGILGDISHTPFQAHLRDILKKLEDVWVTLEKIEQNSGVSIESQQTPPLPKWLPPLLIFVPWTLSIGQHLDMSSLVCCQLSHEILCRSIVRRWLLPPDQIYLNSFYVQVQQAIFKGQKEIASTIVKFSSQLFSYDLPGASVLLRDLVTGCYGVLKADAARVPRYEALVLMNAVLQLVEERSILRDEIVSILKRSACVDPGVESRCLAIQQIGLLVYMSLKSNSTCQDLLDLVNIIVASIKFSNESVAMAAIDVLSLWVDLQAEITAQAKETVIKGLCSGIAELMKGRDSPATSKILGGLLMCLRDWLMATPLSWLLQAQLLELSLTVMSALVCGSAFHLPLPEMGLEGSHQVELGPVRPSRRHRATSGSGGSNRIPFDAVDSEDQSCVLARSVVSHLLTYLEHYPLLGGAAQLPSAIVEMCTMATCHHDDVFSDILSCPRMQFLMIGDTLTVTVCEDRLVARDHLVEGDCTDDGDCTDGKDHTDDGDCTDGKDHTDDGDCTDGKDHTDDGDCTDGKDHTDDGDCTDEKDHTDYGEHTLDGQQFAHEQDLFIKDGRKTFVSGLIEGDSVIRFIIRNVSGKVCWDATRVVSASIDRSPVGHVVSRVQDSPALNQQDVVVVQEIEDIDVTASHDGHTLPVWSTWTDQDVDILDELLLFIANTSSECVLYPGHGLNEPSPCPSLEREEDELAMAELLEAQDQREGDFWSDASKLPCVSCEPKDYHDHCITPVSFSTCRQFLSHFGWLDLQKRSTLHHLNRDQWLIRQLKFLDNANSQSRQIYKMAVLYVGPGQEDQHSILSNTCGSKQFEEFVSGLGWEVELSTHKGYMGGLVKDFAHSITAPYYATPSEEVFYHVSTRMGGTLKQKIRHLGNDHVHIVWSEHYRDYRKSIFKTEFADVLIILYPLKSGLCRTHIIKKPKVSLFGPLFDGALVPFEQLPSLVRSTAINACLRISKQTALNFKGRYLERQNYLSDLSRSAKRLQSFENFALNNVHPGVTPPGGSATPKHTPIRTAESVNDISGGIATPTRHRSNTFTGGSTDKTPSAPLTLSASLGTSVMKRSCEDVLLTSGTLHIQDYSNSPKLSRH